MRSHHGNGRLRNLSAQLSYLISFLLISGYSLGATSQGKDDERSRILNNLMKGSDGRTPAVKNFDASWAESLTQRNQPICYTNENSDNFEYIGMPVGGIGAGQLYLGGDGQLWFWDIFNTNDEHGSLKGEEAYEFPYRRSEQDAPGVVSLEQGFALRIRDGEKTITKKLNRDGFRDISFLGQYPIGEVTYRDQDVPLSVKLEAFSPFIPLDLEHSVYPATVMEFAVTNTSGHAITVDLAGWLENAVCLESRRVDSVTGDLVNTVEKLPGLSVLYCRADRLPSRRQPRPNIVLEDFEQGLDRWKIEGEAFNPSGELYRHKVRPEGYGGRRLADSYNSEAVDKDRRDDKAKGRLLSPEYRAERDYIRLSIGGGRHPGRACVNVLVDGKVVGSVTGENSETLKPVWISIAEYRQKPFHIEILDKHAGRWGHILVDDIVLTDTMEPLEIRYDYGTMALALLDKKATMNPQVDMNVLEDVFAPGKVRKAMEPFSGGKLVGSIVKTMKLKPQETQKAIFLITWYFKNSRVEKARGKYYGARYKDALAVCRDLAGDYERLAGVTRQWRDTWYDSTLPYWFLDRTFLNTSILASSTCHLFEDGTFYGFEGGYQGPGTCTHVWGYVHAPGRLFPQLEKSLREQTDFVDFPEGGFHSDTGLVEFRGRFGYGLAVDGQSGVILRSYLTHQMMPDYTFLEANWPAIRQAMTYLTEARDGNHDGILEGAQHNTLDSNWYGKVAWLSLHYQAALRAAAAMAMEMNELAYARQCTEMADRGRRIVETELFNGEYFYHVPDPADPNRPGIRNGCEYSQLLGQSWAYQVGLGSILDPVKVTTALDSLWRYNFTTDVGPYRQVHTDGRWYAMPGEGGLVACTWPNGGLEAQREAFKHDRPRFAAYNNECQNGYEYAATSLMMWHGFPYRALAHTRVMHEQRYHGSKRNPWCEIEWGCHYSRSMASYGLFTAACGFEYHGPQGYIGFAPRITPDHFKAAFTSAQGWGSFSQIRKETAQTAELELKHGNLRLNTVKLVMADGRTPVAVDVMRDGRKLPATFSYSDNEIRISLAPSCVLNSGSVLKISISLQ